MNGSTLIVQAGAHRVSRAELTQFAPPPRTSTWRPVSHSDLIASLHGELDRRGLRVTQEHYAVQKKGLQLFATLDLDWQDTGEYAAAMGLRTSNDKSLSITLVAGVRVFVCSNLCYAGDLIALKRKHTKGLDLDAELSRGLDRYQEGVVTLQGGIERLKTIPLGRGQAKQFIYDIFRQKIVPARFFSPVVESWHATTDNHPQAHHLWTLHNAFTSQIKTLPPAPAFRAAVRLGQFFSLT